MRSLMLAGGCMIACLALPLSALADAHPSAAAPVLSERALREECSASSQAGMRDCLTKKAEESQAALRQAEGSVTGAIAKWDEDAKYLVQAKSKFAASNKQFASYRDAHCAFATSLAGGAAGNSAEIARLACVAELNSRRAEQLRDAVSDLPLK